ncbi:type II toxin-antitoxin system RelE/ParE family toxin [Tolypothrix sp. LEGE 11397]|uniref:type II toxin-antitoxin system RelE/ParE family toxin n=1 Tax=Tolypothrix sp. LEGE 11397 TaxID=2777971 RepID=UPI001882D1B3|nr:type II toxin-antitoxin system RelE/ParE family toxin [Tolypothrix sp. LEGE 11397]MBE9082840.1 type II toxin-antitoxin system RelE/ParE family toxin [Tolypothrix sp. LEGE 11397]
MIFQVNVSPPAIADIENIYLWLKAQNSTFADQWFNELTQAIDSLEQLPARCPLAPESQELDREVRQLLCRTSKKMIVRILFGIAGSQVSVYRVRHTSQQYLSKEDFDL